MMKIIINKCFGGFGLSDLAYKELIKLGIPRRKYIQQKRDDKSGRFLSEPLNEGEVIFDKELTPLGEYSINDLYYKFKSISSRYWETWIDSNRSHPLVLKVVKKLGKKSWGRHAKLCIVEIPDGIDFTIEDYDGMEHIAEKHRIWS